MHGHFRPDKVRTEEGEFLMGEAGRQQEADLDQAWDMGVQTPDQPRLEVAGVKARPAEARSGRGKGQTSRG